MRTISRALILNVLWHGPYLLLVALAALLLVASWSAWALALLALAVVWLVGWPLGIWLFWPAVAAWCDGDFEE